MKIFSLLLLLLHIVFLKADKNCSDYNVATCIEYLASELFGSCSTDINATLQIDQNMSYLGRTTTLYANVTNYNNTANSSLTHLFCYVQMFSIFPTVHYLGCAHVNTSNASIKHTWETAGNITVHVLIINQTGPSFGCAQQQMDLGYQHKMNVTFSLNQSSYNNSANHTLFKVGNITIYAEARENATGYYDDDIYSGSGSGSGDDDLTGSIEYRYRFFFNNDSSQVNYSNMSNYSVTHYFSEQPLQIIYVDVIKNDTTHKIPRLCYGSYTKKISVLAPVSNPKIYLDSNYKKNTGIQIPVYVESDGSHNISVKWHLVGTVNITNFTCSASEAVLNNNDTRKFAFFCFFNDSGDYRFNATFNNSISTMNYSTDPFTISPGIPPKTVVAVSTTAVVFIVMLLVVAVAAILIIGVYIPYRRYKNKMTETADFTFIELQKPSLAQRVRFQAGKIKERFSKKHQKVGLVTRSIDDNGEAIDSFYGSLNPFAAHETL